VTRVVPVPDDLSREFWTAAAEGRLVIRRCADCGTFHHPPRPLCPACQGSDCPFTEVSGRARLYSWTRTEHSVLPALEVPYVCLVVELVEQEGLYLVSDGIGLDLGELRQGTAMHVVFDAVAGDATLPRFVPGSGS
jgi:uncharacterized protein